MAFLPVALLTVTCAYLISLSLAVSPCITNQAPVAWIPDPEDCNSFHICVGQMSVPLKCDEGRVWQPDYKVCCLKGSAMDTCSKSVEAVKPKIKIFKPEDPETCRAGMTKKLAHPKHCARYFDCAAKGAVFGFSEEKERECPHPLMFNSNTGKCEDHSQVDCGEKIKPKDACEYEMNKCHRSHCIPCYVRFPSCADLEDGNQVWKGKERSPYYAVCKDQRVVKHGRCPSGKLFHPRLLVCDDARKVQES